ncbi:hypothetical protein [Nibricoccus sp. IMCC34717]|uniref:hypothetical protein n=1 Tax=Nibricoccus sp. IMCC34717 TaxID=3034021 RepID=UPI00384B46F8
MQKFWIVALALLLPAAYAQTSDTPAFPSSASSASSASSTSSASSPSSPSSTSSTSFTSSFFYSGAPASSDTVLGEALNWHGVQIRPSVSYSLSRSSGRPSSFTSRGRTTIHRFSPGVDLALGTTWSLSYNPSWTWHSSKAYSDNVSHRLNLRAARQLGRGELGFSQGYSRNSDDALLETGVQTRIETWSTNLSYGAPISSRLSYVIEGAQELRYTNRYTDTRDWNSNASLRYAVTEALSVGTGVGLGYTDTDPGPNARTRRVFITTNWAVSPKLSLSGRVGYDRRKLMTHPATISDGLTYDASVRYALLPSVSFTAGANKGFGTSLFSGSSTERATRYVGTSLVLAQRFTLSARYSRGETDYAGTGLLASRSDKTKGTYVDLSAPLGNRASLALFYQRTRNDSSFSLFEIASEEYGLRFSYRF